MVGDDNVEARGRRARPVVLEEDGAALQIRLAEARDRSADALASAT